MIGLLDLPNELLLATTKLLDYGWDLTAMGLANRRLHGIVNTYLYQHKLPACSRQVLYWAVEKGNEDALTRCLKAGVLAYFNESGTRGAMWKAIHAGRDRILEIFIENGIISFHDKEESGWRADLRRYWDTPLYTAVSRGNIGVARLLVAYGIDDSRSGRNSDLLSIAAKEGDLAMMKYLMDEVGYDPSQQCDDGYTALGGAARMDRTEAAELLLERGADPNI